jgi:hypothetical protein
LVATSSSRSSTPSGSSPSEGGLRGWLRQFRELGAAATQQAEEAARARNAAKNGATVDATPVPNANGVREASGSGGTSTVRRTRPNPKAAPMLVKPASSADLPEHAIQRDGKDSTSTSVSSGPLPEVAIAGTAKKSNTAAAPASRGAGTGTKARVAAAGAAAGTRTRVAAAAGTSPRPASSKASGNSGNTQRRANGGTGKGSGSSSGASSSRNRGTNNRAKGGR